MSLYYDDPRGSPPRAGAGAGGGGAGAGAGALVDSALQAVFEQQNDGRLDEALAGCLAGLEARRAGGQPLAAWLQMLGLIQLKRLALPEAEAALREGVAMTPQHGPMWFYLAQVLAEGGPARMDEALNAYARAADLGDARAAVGVSMILRRQNRLEDAAEAGAEAIRRAPRSSPAYENAASALLAQGRMAESLATLRTGVNVAPEDVTLRVGLASASQYDELLAPAELERRHAEAAALAERVHGHAGHGHAGHSHAGHGARRAGQPSGGRLRVCVMSSDLRDHSVSYFARPLIEHAGAAGMDLSVVHTGPRDEVTARLRALGARWIDTGRADDAAVARAVRGLDADVLIDLNGYTTGYCLGALTKRVAPVQVSYLGYPDDPRLGALDGWLVDPWTDPVGPGAGPRGQGPDRRWRLDRCFLAYAPPEDAPAAAEAGRVLDAARPLRLGSFNALAKLGPRTLSLWARVLGAIPHATLTIKSPPLADARTRERFARRAGEAGIDASRLDLRAGGSPRAEHLRAYHDLDLALDPVHYHGTTTTCEALWMGVPVLTLAGRRHAARVGVSLLNAVGLGELVAEDEEAYVRLAAALAQDRGRLAGLGGDGLRARVAGSALLDGAGLCRAIAARLERAVSSALP